LPLVSMPAIYSKRASICKLQQSGWQKPTWRDMEIAENTQRG
jgi:hypothetical protein